jgi:hypothetical protein
VGDQLALPLKPSLKPSWFSQEAWQQTVGSILYLRLTCLHHGWAEPWVLRCEVQIEDGQGSVDVP